MWYLLICVILIFVLIIAFLVYEAKYFSSEKFLILKNEVAEYVNECNELNQHISELQAKHIKGYVSQSQYASINSNTGKWNYTRHNLQSYSNKENVYDCSLSVIKNAREQPFKYLCKYFGIDADEETLCEYEAMLNDYIALEQGKGILTNKKNRIMNSHKKDIPFLIRQFGGKVTERRLNFHEVVFSNTYYPVYTFRYISAGGNSGQSCSIKLNINTLPGFIEYLSTKVKFKQSAKGQRRLMTPQLREVIKQRDNYTCRNCGISTHQEPHLLLEIDHIVPISRGGMTTESNLQTLCWKCNRSKGAK